MWPFSRKSSKQKWAKIIADLIKQYKREYNQFAEVDPATRSVIDSQTRDFHKCIDKAETIFTRAVSGDASDTDLHQYRKDIIYLIPNHIGVIETFRTRQKRDIERVGAGESLRHATSFNKDNWKQKYEETDSYGRNTVQTLKKLQTELTKARWPLPIG